MFLIKAYLYYPHIYCIYCKQQYNMIIVYVRNYYLPINTFTINYTTNTCNTRPCTMCFLFNRRRTDLYLQSRS